MCVPGTKAAASPSENANVTISFHFTEMRLTKITDDTDSHNNVIHAGGDVISKRMCGLSNATRSTLRFLPESFSSFAP